MLFGKSEALGRQNWEYYRSCIAWGAALLLLIGLFWSKFLLSLSMILLILAAIGTSDWMRDLQRLLQNKALWASTGIFIVIALACCCNKNQDESLERLRLAIPYLLLPAALGFLPPFSARALGRLIYALVIMATISSIVVLVNYVLNYAEIQESLRVSKAIPTPQKDHIRFSLSICWAFFAGAWLCSSYYHIFTQKIGAWLLGCALLFLAITLHILAVRSGLLAFYAGIFICITYLIINQKRYVLGLGLLSILVAAPIVAYHYLPSFHAKVHLSLYNWHQYKEGNIGGLSDTQRLLSYQIALEVAADRPWRGVGLGDLHDALAEVYARNYPQQKVMFPHNQFLSLYAGAGILGLSAFLFCFFFPLFYAGAYRQWLFLVFFTLISTSFLTENTIFTAIGTALHCFFLLLLCTHLEEIKKIKIN